MLRNTTPCDEPINGKYYCPYMGTDGYVDCEYWCGNKEEYDPDYWESENEEDY